MKKSEHIDDIQPATVDEHVELIKNDKSVIDSEGPDVTLDDFPEWYDEELFKQGQEYYMNNIMVLGFVGLTGLITILSIPDTLDVLVFSKQSSNTCVAFRRYSQTLLHIYNLHKFDVVDKKSKFFKSLNAIRRKHFIGNRRSRAAGLCGIYQRDMAITQFGFIGFALLQAKFLGLSDTFEERKAYNHFWRVIGYLLGISDRINICRKSVKETTELCSKILKSILTTHMENPDSRYLELVRNVLNGIWHIDISMDPEAFISTTYTLAGLEYKKELGWYSRLNMQYRNMLFGILRIPYVSHILRIYFNYLLTFNYWMLEHYPVWAWIFLGMKHSKLKLYSKN